MNEKTSRIGEEENRPPLLLVVDDDPSVRELLTVNLEARRYAVVSASNGAAALDRLKNAIPELIILDIMMPEMDGLEFSKIVRDHQAWGGIPIIMLTAKNTDRDKMICLDILDADEYITKPFEIAHLMAAVERLLHGNA